MKIEKIHLKNFRNYHELDLSFSDRLNIIIGDNAQGKTNILEAIYFLSITKSNLPVNDKNCINKDEIFSKIDGYVDSINGKKKLSILMNINEKKLEINGNEIKKHSEFIGNLRVIIFNPDDIRLIKETPSNRRRFLNIEISQLYGKYINILNEYNVILKQRNEYLKVIKNGNVNNIYFEILTQKLVQLAVEIYKFRTKFVDDINKYINIVYKELSNYDGLQIKYIPNIDLKSGENISEVISNKLKSYYEREIFLGNTLVGPHRDDFIFKLNDDDLLTFGSQGQIKLAILALKLSLIDVFKDVCGEYPVLLLDDLFSELDVNKRNKVIKYLNRDIQTIVTTTDLKNIDKHLVKSALIYKVDNGKIID